MKVEHSIRERRQRLRIPFSSKVIISAGNGIKVEGALDNISINGLFLKGTAKIPEKTPCLVQIFLVGRCSKLTLSVQGYICRQTSEGVAVQFEDDLEWWSMFAVFATYGKPKDEITLKTKKRSNVINVV